MALAIIALSVFWPTTARASSVAVCDTYQVNGGDQAFLMNLNTPLEFGGVVYDGNIYVSPKGTVTFGQGDYTFWDYPATPSISIAAFDYHAFANGVMWGAENNLYVRYGSTSTSVCVDWKVMLWGQSSGDPIYIRMIAEVNPENYTWTPIFQVSSNAPAGARYGVRYTQGGEVFPLTIQTITEPPAENPVIEPEPEVTPEPEATPDTTPVEPEPTPEPTPSPIEPDTTPVEPEPTPEPTPSPIEPDTTPVEPEPTPEPTIAPPVAPVPERTVMPEPTPLPEKEPPVEPTPTPTTVPPTEKPTPEPTPSKEPAKEPTENEPETLPEPEQASTSEKLGELSQIDPSDLTDEQALELFALALEIFETAEVGSEEYQQALDALMVIAQSDDPELPAELAAIPFLGDIAGAILDIFNDLGNLGADMSPQVRETAEKIVVVAVIVTQIVAVTAIGAMASTSIRRP